MTSSARWLCKSLEVHIAQVRKGLILMKQHGNNEEPNVTRVIAIDLQQTQTLPDLTTSDSIISESCGSVSFVCAT